MHFDPQKLHKFLRLAGISKVLDDPSILVNLGVAEKQEGKVIFNNAGILFFAKNLHDIYYHTAVTCALYKGTEKVDVLDRRDFNEDLISNIDGAMNFLKQWIPVRYEMTGTPQRREVPEIPYDALREAVINAVTHRNYFERGANVMVELFDDRIEITNPGGLVKGLRPEDFGKRSVLRNSNLANLLREVKYIEIEKMGTGISKMRTSIADAGLPPVKFEFDTFFAVTFTRKRRGEQPSFTETFGVNFGVKGKRLERLVTILETLYKGEALVDTQLAHRFHVSIRTVESDIQFLRDNGILTFVGAPKRAGMNSLHEGRG